MSQAGSGEPIISRHGRKGRFSPAYPPSAPPLSSAPSGQWPPTGTLQTLLLRGARPGPGLREQLATFGTRTQLLAGPSTRSAKAGLACKGFMAGAGPGPGRTLVAGPQSQGSEGPPPGPSIGKPETRQGGRKKQEVGQKGDRRNDKGTQWVGSICSAKPQVATTKGLGDAQHPGGGGGGVGTHCDPHRIGFGSLG